MENRRQNASQGFQGSSRDYNNIAYLELGLEGIEENRIR